MALKRLGERFNIDKIVINHLVNVVGLTSLDDLGALETEDIRECVRSVEGVSVVLQTSRLKQAWMSIKKAGDEADDAEKRAAAEEDFDALLPRGVLDEVARLNGAVRELDLKMCQALERQNVADR